MAASQAKTGFGTLFGVGDGATPEVFTNLAEVLDLNAPNETTDKIETSHMQSPDNSKEFIPGLTDGGETSFDINFLPGVSDDAAIQALRHPTGNQNFRITYPNGAKWVFSGFLAGYAPKAPVNDRMRATVTFKISGSYVETP